MLRSPQSAKRSLSPIGFSAKSLLLFESEIGIEEKSLEDCDFSVVEVLSSGTNDDMFSVFSLLFKFLGLLEAINGASNPILGPKND